MKKKYLLPLAIIMYFIATITIGYYFYFEINKMIIMRPLGRVIILLISSIFMYIGAITISKYLDKYKELPFKINIIIWFLLYLILLTTLTLFDDYFNRGNFKKNFMDIKTIKNYINTSFNIIPFKTIYMYISKYLSGDFSSKIFLYNIVGNILALTPFSIFLPLLFKKQNNYKVFLFTMIIIVLLIEGMQFLTLSGSCDIDDLILNVLGACIAYKILKINKINNFIRKIFLKAN